MTRRDRVAVAPDGRRSPCAGRRRWGAREPDQPQRDSPQRSAVRPSGLRHRRRSLMEFHQILVTARPGDAISNSVFELRSLLGALAVPDIYARYIHPDLAGEVLPLEAYGRRESPSRGSHDDVLLFHASIGEPAVFSFVNDRPERACRALPQHLAVRSVPSLRPRVRWFARWWPPRAGRAAPQGGACTR